MTDFNPSEADVEAVARAAFDADSLGGHHKGGPWTWESIGEDGRVNYRALAELSLRAAHGAGWRDGDVVATLMETLRDLDATLSACCVAVGEPVPVDVPPAIERLWSLLASYRELADAVEKHCDPGDPERPDIVDLSLVLARCRRADPR